MNTLFSRVRDSFTAEATQASVAWRYGMVGICLLLLSWHLWWLHRLPPSYPFPEQRLIGLIVPLMLLFNHLSSAFRWSRPVTVVLRIVAWVCTLGGSAYIFFHLWVDPSKLP